MEYLTVTLPDWLTYFVVLSLVGSVGWMVWNVFLLCKSDDRLKEAGALRDEEKTREEKTYIRKKARWAIICALYVMLVLPGFFLFKHSGKPVEITPAERMGGRERIDAMPEEKPIKQIKEEAEQRAPAQLKRQSEEPENSDDYIERALKRAKDRKGDGDERKNEAD